MENKVKTIGIVGGGQLGRMLAQAGQKLGFKIIVLDPTPNSPAGQLSDEQMVGSFKDKDKILELSEKVDALTFEIEGVNIEALEEIESSGKSVHPSPKILKIIKDKFAQKTFLKNNFIPVSEFAIITSTTGAVEQGKLFGYPYLLKARFDAYDGRGNYVVKKESDIKDAFLKLNQENLYAEKFAPFIKELSVVSARDIFGTIISYPTVETIHKNNICHIVHSPAKIEKEINERVQKLAGKVLELLAGVGVFAVEMFLTKSGEILVNEIAPRVHNSGHHTIEAFNTSQFEQHMRAISGQSLLMLEPTSETSVMINILGERDAAAEVAGLDRVKEISGVYVHIYGKLETRKERKMGHITAVGSVEDDVLEKAITARKHISI